VGAKYLPELGYTGLYEATWVAGRELGAFAQIRQVRDLATYALRDVASIDAAAVRARFTDTRWRAFKRDLLVFGPRGPIDNTLRFGNEPARHKVLDILGDLALVGHDLAGRLVAYRSGHPLNIELARTLRDCISPVRQRATA